MANWLYRLLTTNAHRFHAAMRRMQTDPREAARIDKIIAGLDAAAAFDGNDGWIDLGSYDGVALAGKLDGTAVKVGDAEFRRSDLEGCGMAVAEAFRRLDEVF